MRFVLAAAAWVLGMGVGVAGGGAFELKRAEALPFLVDREGVLRQVVKVEGKYEGMPGEIVVRWDGAEVGRQQVVAGEVGMEVAVRRSDTKGTSALVVGSGAGVLARAEVARGPVREVTVYVVPHSHVDIGYTRPQPEIERKQVGNLNTALKLIRESKGNLSGERFRWTVEAAWTIEHFLKTEPAEKVAELEEAVCAGDVELDAAYANVLTGLCREEELARVYRYGVRLRDRFGVPVDLAMISDVPGYTWGTVAAMAQAGVRYFSIGPNLQDRIGTTLAAWQDRPFYWETADGKHRVLCWVSYKGYAWSHFMKTIHEGAVLEYARHLEQIAWPYDVACVRWSGVGDNAVPAGEVVESVKHWNAKYAWPKLRIATAREGFEALERKYGKGLPVVRGDWTPYWEDGAGSSALETGMNRASSERMAQAEALWAMLRGWETYPAERFWEGWRYVLLYSEHTWGAWCSVTEPESGQTNEQWGHKRGYALEADRRSRELLATALGERTGSAGKVDVYNTNSWERGGLVTISKGAGDRVVGEDGKDVASQRMENGDLVFRAEGVPGFGGKRYEVREGTAGAVERGVKVDGLTLSNGVVRVRVDGRTGDIVELVGASGRNVVRGVRGINEYNYVEGAAFDRPRKAGVARVRVGEAGPVVGSLVIEQDAPGCRKLVRVVRLVAGADWVEIENRVDKERAKVAAAPNDWGRAQAGENGKEAVHFAFPFEVPGGKVRVDTPFAVVKVDQEQMAGACKNWFSVQRFVDVSNEVEGVTLVTLDAPLATIGGNTATLLGSQANPAAWRTEVGATQEVWSWVMNNYWYTNYRAWQEGEVVFRYAVRPHGAYEAAEVQRFGMERSRELVGVPAVSGEMSRPRVRVGDERVVATGLMVAEDGRGVVVRLYNPREVEVVTPVEVVGGKAVEVRVPGRGVVSVGGGR